MKKQIIGQEKILKLFSGAVAKDRLSHCYTLVGEKGMGKSTLTEHIAKMIVCEKGTACGVCKGCIMAEAGTHPDISHIEPEEGKSSISVNTMRSMVEDIYIRPYTAKKKVYIINNFEKAQVHAQNAVLKALEEPPEYVVFLLTISSEKDVLETIKSRSVMIKMLPYSKEEIKRAINLAENEAEFIASLCGGNIGKGIKLAEDEGFVSLRNTVFEAIFELLDNDRIMPYANLIKKENAEEVLECTLSFFRDVLLVKEGNFELVTNKDFLEKITESAKNIKTKSVVSAVESLIKTSGNLQRNINFNLAVMSTVFGSLEEING